MHQFWPLWILCIMVPSSAAAISDEAIRQLQPESYTLRKETLTSIERQQIYLQLIENFVGWTEQTNRFVADDQFEPGGGAFNANGHGVTWPRGNSNLCMAYALLLNVHPDREFFTIHKIPRAQIEHHLRSAMRAVCLSNKNCARHKPTRHQWGGPAWQSALELIGCAWAAYLYKDKLDPDTLTLVRDVVCREADYLDKKIPSQRFGNTGAEDCCWNAPLLAWAANQYADHRHAEKWDMLGKQWAINGTSIGQDARATIELDGQPLQDWIVSENLHPDLTLDNHAMWSVGYQCAQQHYGEAALAYRLFGRPVPESYAHHADAMWRDVTSALFLWDGDILFPHGQDWSWKVYSSIEYLCWQNCCRQNRAAGAFESRALQMIYRRQLALGTGDLGAAVSKSLDFGNQTVKPKRWAFCYLMHTSFTPPEPVAFTDAEKESHGIHLFPFTKVAIHRTREKCVSVSWHPRHQPIYILPEGDSTFVDPPFFFPYDKRSGCPQVDVSLLESETAPDSPPPQAPAGDTAAGYRPAGRIAANVASGSSKGRAANWPDWIEYDDRQGLQVRYRKPWPHDVMQSVTVFSLPDEATVYGTLFRAGRDAKVTIGPQFPCRAAAPPGFEKAIHQYRGDRWLNMSDHVGFVAIDSLPGIIPKNHFRLTDRRTYRVRKGEWFGRAVLVVYVGQSHQQTARLANKVQLLDDSMSGKFALTLDTSRGPQILPFDFFQSGWGSIEEP